MYQNLSKGINSETKLIKRFRHNELKLYFRLTTNSDLAQIGATRK